MDALLLAMTLAHRSLLAEAAYRAAEDPQHVGVANLSWMGHPALGTLQPGMPDTEALLARLFSGADRYVELDQIVMAEVAPHFQKVALIVASTLRALGRRCRSSRLYGDIGSDEPDLYLTALLARVVSLVAAGVLEARGDLSEPRYSELRIPDAG